MIAIEQMEVVDDFTPFGVRAFTTTREVGNFSTGSSEPVKDVIGRWDAVRATLAAWGVTRMATAAQVHGDRVIVHVPGWEGWLRGPKADGHIAPHRNTALVVSIADCVPVFIAHPRGTVGVLHSGWRGTAARIVERGIAALTGMGCPADELHMHLGPAICGKCYEVSPDVIRQLTGELTDVARTVDLRALIASHARASGVERIAISPRCTRCDNDRFFSHRARDAGRQISVIAAVS